MLYILPELEMYTGTMWYQSIILKHKHANKYDLRKHASQYDLRKHASQYDLR